MLYRVVSNDTAGVDAYNVDHGRSKALRIAQHPAAVELMLCGVGVEVGLGHR